MLDNEQQAAYDNAAVKFKEPTNASNMQFILNLTSGLFIFAIGFYQIITFLFIIKIFTDLKFFVMFAPFFYLAFGLIIIFLEVGYKAEEIYEQFSFMKYYIGRSLFHFFIAGAVAGQLYNKYARWAWGIILSIPGIIYLIMFIMGRRKFDLVVRGTRQQIPQQ